MIYSLVTLSLCMIVGKYIGLLLGTRVGINADVGGVGFAIILLVLITNSPRLAFTQKKEFKDGVNFWKQMYMPVVVALAATQNVYRMLTSGLVAIVAGSAAVAVPFLIVYLLHKHDERRQAKNED